jgi:hypothetical protein
MSNLLSSIGSFIQGIVAKVTGHPSSQAIPVTPEIRALIVKFEDAFDEVKAATDKALPIAQELASVYPPAASVVTAFGIGKTTIDGAEQAFEAFVGIPDADDAPATPAVTPVTPSPTKP